MKIRNGFVSNSSSSSFIIMKRNLNDTQIKAIKNHISYAKKLMEKSHIFNLGYIGIDDAWSIDEKEDTLYAYTNMDNFDMYTFLTDGLNISENDIKYVEY